MKKTSSRLLQLAVLILALTFQSCEKYFGDVNVNPNAASTATPEIILPTIEVALAFAIGGDLSRNISIFTNHFRGYGRCIFIDRYNLIPADLNRLWGHFYAFALKDIDELKNLADTHQAPHYKAIAMSLEAFTIMTMTDVWDKMPYEEALRGTDILQPVYDNQQAIYNHIFDLIAESNVLLGGPNPGRQPGSEDFIMNGDTDRWKKFNNVLEARAWLHLGKKDFSNYQKVLNALQKGGFQSNTSDARFPFGNSPSTSSPWYQFNTQRGDMDVDVDYINVLTDLNDPRISIYGETVFTDPHPFFVIDQHYPLMTFTEQKFMEAECLFRVSGPQAAHQAYLDAIRASFDEIEMTEADYLDYVAQAEIDPGNDQLSLNHIMTQKWIALFAQPEPFNDWRRTGLPELIPNTGEELPRRLPYPQTEMDFNTNTPQNISVFDKVWWDI